MMRRTTGLATAWMLVAGLLFGVAVIGTNAQSDEAPFALQPSERVDPATFRVTTFAEGLFFPYGMVELDDGSLLVGTSTPTGGSYYASTGELLRLADADANGVADAPGAALYSGLPGMLVSMARAGDLVFVVSVQGGGEQIAVLRLGDAPADPLTEVGIIHFGYAVTMDHGTYAVAAREDARGADRHDLYFNVGSLANDAVGATVTASGLVTGDLADASIYRVAIDDRAGAAAFGALERIASGLRNAAGIAVHPETGDLLFEDNGIDTPNDRIVALSADEVNRIPAAEIGGEVDDFGFPNVYVDYGTGEPVGDGGVAPVAALTPWNQSENEGAAGIAVAPAGFPDGLNDGVFVGIHGQWDEIGIENEENPLLYVDLGSGDFVHVVGNDEAAVGHLDGLLSTDDALFAADLSGVGSLSGAEPTGAIYRIAPR